MSARGIDVFFYGLFMDSDLLCLNSAPERAPCRLSEGVFARILSTPL